MFKIGNIERAKDKMEKGYNYSDLNILYGIITAGSILIIITTGIIAGLYRYKLTDKNKLDRIIQIFPNESIECIHLKEETNYTKIRKQWIREDEENKQVSMEETHDLYVNDNFGCSTELSKGSYKFLIECHPNFINSGNSPPTPCDGQNDIQCFAYNTKREVERSTFTVGECIGSGNFGNVNIGQLSGLYHTYSMTTVAIKSINSFGSGKELQDLFYEIKIMSNVKPHPNLVSMIGSCTSELKESRKLWLLLEYCPHGNLQRYLVKNKSNILAGRNEAGKKEDTLNSRCLLKWAHDIAKGMEYLAQNKIMHGDLAARNILLDESPGENGMLVAKVADFGLSKNFYDNSMYQKESRIEVPWKWMALEYLLNDYFTLASDVWSFGVLFWEILSFGRRPYGHQGYDELVENLKSGYRLPIPQETEYVLTWPPDKLYKDLSNVCFVIEPTDRGTFGDVLEILKKELTSNELTKYDRMSEIYFTTRASNYLSHHNSKRESVHTVLKLDNDKPNYAE